MSLIQSKACVSISTRHSAELQWWWKDSHVHNSDYRDKVNDAIASAVTKACLDPDLCEDTSYCCQWEGVHITGEDLEKVTAAGNALAKVLDRFKFVEFIG